MGEDMEDIGPVIHHTDIHTGGDILHMEGTRVIVMHIITRCVLWKYGIKSCKTKVFSCFFQYTDIQTMGDIQFFGRYPSYRYPYHH